MEGEISERDVSIPFIGSGIPQVEERVLSKLEVERFNPLHRVRYSASPKPKARSKFVKVSIPFIGSGIPQEFRQWFKEMTGLQVSIPFIGSGIPQVSWYGHYGEMDVRFNPLHRVRYSAS